MTLHPSQHSRPLGAELGKMNVLLTSIFPSIGVFSNELALLIRWPKFTYYNLV